MIRKTMVWIAALTATLLLGAPGVARATTTWVPASCATGSFDPVRVDELGHYLLPVHMTLCEPNKGFTFAVVLFLPGGYLPMATGDKLQSYRSAEVIADVFPQTLMPVFGLCLMRDLDTRTACVRVDTAADGVVTSTPIEASDALVAEQVLFLPKPPVIWPNYCSTCVSINV
ncbi:hypothetical protein [Actinoplanes sp. NPDC026619]|uniref:hypothetical protein n=1 Tax=Actinoplanes sp. NPDC026619 TaxID=3155798 RepID=UPI0033FADE9F